MENTVPTIADLLSIGTSLVSWIATSVVSLAEVVVTTPLLGIGIGLFLTGAAVSFIVRMIRIA